MGSPLRHFAEKSYINNSRLTAASHFDSSDTMDAGITDVELKRIGRNQI